MPTWLRVLEARKSKRRMTLVKDLGTEIMEGRRARETDQKMARQAFMPEHSQNKYTLVNNIGQFPRTKPMR